MATISDIKKEMTDAFIANETIKATYELEDGKTFEEQFSKVSLESILFYVVATSIFALQFLFDRFKEYVETRIRAAISGTKSWYHNLVVNWEYNSQKIIKFCSIAEEFPFLRVKINTENHGVLGPESDEMIALRSFLNKEKFAGTQINLTSQPPETIDIKMTVWVSASEYTSTGKIIGTEEKPIEAAIDNYLANIVYDGTFYKSRLVDDVQVVRGVNDVELASAKINNIELAATRQSKTGAFVANKIITYVLG